MNRTDVLGVEFDNVTMAEAVERALALIEARECRYVVTPNPEIVMLAKEDAALKSALAGAALVLPDGVGIVKGAAILGRPMKEKVPGIDFACGVMASPCRRRPLFLRPRRVWMDGRHEALLDVRAARPAERAALILLSLAALGAFVWLGGHFARPWSEQWSIGSAESRERGAAERCRVLRSLARDYPDYALLNECVRLDPVMEKSLNETIAAMSLTLEANPKNLYNVSMLAHLLARAGRYDEAELIQRRFYEGDGPPPSQIGAWYAVYGRNLLLWGYDDFKKGRHASGLSKMHYAMRMHAHASLHAQTLHRADRTWTVSWRRQEDMEFLRRCKQCVRLRTLMGMPEDDSWSRPLEPGGKPSLYRRWGLEDVNN